MVPTLLLSYSNIKTKFAQMICWPKKGSEKGHKRPPTVPEKKLALNFGHLATNYYISQWESGESGVSVLRLALLEVWILIL